MLFHETHSLGHRAFLLFLSRRIKFALLLFLITGLLWHYTDRISPSYRIWLDYASRFFLLISLGYLTLILVRTYFEYSRYTYRFAEEAFIITFGYITRNEIAAMYHHIQSVNIRRTMADRAVGVSQIVIIMTGVDRDAQRYQIILPALGRSKARLVQGELLRRARKHAIPSAPDEA
ncbi:MAG: PH domain-containing protein [Candidatus Liptonbacteria bacterium]